MRAIGPEGLLDGANRAYSDSNPPESLEMTLAAEPAAVPALGEAHLWTPDGKSLRMEAADGTVTQIGPSSGSTAWPAVLANTALITEVVIARFDLAANALVAGNMLNLRWHGQTSSTATIIYRLRIGTLGAITDALLAQFATSAAGVANAHTQVDALISILTATTATAGGNAQLVGATIGVTTGAFAAATVNLAVANRISLTAQLSAATTTLTSRAGVLSKMI